MARQKNIESFPMEYLELAELLEAQPTIELTADDKNHAIRERFVFHNFRKSLLSAIAAGEISGERFPTIKSVVVKIQESNGKFRLIYTHVGESGNKMRSMLAGWKETAGGSGRASERESASERASEAATQLSPAPQNTKTQEDILRENGYIA